MMRPITAVCIWLGLTIAAASYGIWLGLGSREFAWAIGAFTILLAGEILLAAPKIQDTLLRICGPQGGVLAALWPLGTFLLFNLGTRRITGQNLSIAVAYSLLPILLAIGARGAKAGAWQDYVAMVAIFLPFKLGWLGGLFVTSFRLGTTLPLFFAVNTALAVFLFVRRLDGVGYSAGLRLAWIGLALLMFALIAAADIPASLALHFVRFDPHAARWAMAAPALTGTFILVAWPEEFLFRGLLQNALRNTLGGENRGWIAASIIFGLWHIGNGYFPNWKYGLLATVAGLGYGMAWRKSRSIFPAACVHALVDTVWHLLFPTL